MFTAAEYSNDAESYRRAARKLRWTHSNDPARLHIALRDLARDVDGARPSPIPERTSEVRDFAAAVAASLDGPVLRYANRKALIQQAATLGIKRFDANLLIASVQHRLAGNVANRSQTIVPPIGQRSSWAVPLAAVLGAQIAIVVAAFLLFHT